MMMPNWTFRNVLGACLWIAALAVLVVDVVLVRQNRALRDAAAPQIAAGTTLESVSGVDVDGHVARVEMPPARAKLVLFTFSPLCAACQANQPGWANLARIVRRTGTKVLWVSRDPIDVTREYCVTNGIPPTEVIADPPYRTYLQLGLARVPNTIVVGSGGIVDRVWAGRLQESDWQTIASWFRGGGATSD